MADLHVLELGSDPYERGLTHGRSMRKEIAENIDTYLARFAAGGLDAQTAREEGETWVGVMRDQHADYACPDSRVLTVSLLDDQGAFALNGERVRHQVLDAKKADGQ